MGLFFRKSKKIAPGIRLNLSKRAVGVSAGVRGARVSTNTKGEKYISGGRGGLYFRKRLRSKNGEQEPAGREETKARNLAFVRFLVARAEEQGITDGISDDFTARAAEAFFGDASSPEAQAAIAFVKEA